MLVVHRSHERRRWHLPDRGVGCLILTELARSVVDKWRKAATGIGGTQDIAVVGTILCLLCFVGAVIAALHR
jgi:hypothetical protein